jgi:hypothetical protein
MLEARAPRLARWLVMFATRGDRHTQGTNLRGREIHNDILEIEIIIAPRRMLQRMARP